MTYLNIEANLCYQMHAPFLIDNSRDLALKNFNYTESNIVQDYQNKSWLHETNFTKLALLLWTTVIENPGKELAEIQAFQILKQSDYLTRQNDSICYLETMQMLISRKSWVS